MAVCVYTLCVCSCVCGREYDMSPPISTENAMRDWQQKSIMMMMMMMMMTLMMMARTLAKL